MIVQSLNMWSRIRFLKIRPNSHDSVKLLDTFMVFWYFKIGPPTVIPVMMAL